MYEYWEAQRKAGRDLTSGELAAEVEGITIHAARKAVARYRAGRIPVPKTPGLAPRTVKNVHRMIHLAPASAVAWRYIDYNPAEHAALPRESRKGIRKRSTTWKPDELAAWLAVAVNDRDAGIWVLAATTGMRRSELAGAERELLDLDGATLEIADTRVVVDGRADESDGKTESGRRVISLDPLTVAYLRRHLVMLDTEREAFETATTIRGCSSATRTGGRCTPTRSPTVSTSSSTGPGSSGFACTTCGIRRTAGLCALSACSCWWGSRRWCFRLHNPGGRCYRASESSQPIRDGAGWLAALLGAARIGGESLVCSFRYRMQR